MQIRKRVNNNFPLYVLSVMTYRNFCMILAEFIGTFLLVLFGCMGAVELNGAPEGLIKSFNWGMAVLMVIQVCNTMPFEYFKKSGIILKF